MVHSPRSTADTVMNFGPGGMDYHRYLATDKDEGNSEDSLPDPTDTINKTLTSKVKSRQVNKVPFVRVNGTLVPNNSTAN